jgi:hypothetical protein
MGEYHERMILFLGGTPFVCFGPCKEACSAVLTSLDVIVFLSLNLQPPSSWKRGDGCRGRLSCGYILHGSRIRSCHHAPSCLIRQVCKILVDQRWFSRLQFFLISLDIELLDAMPRFHVNEGLFWPRGLRHSDALRLFQ